MTASILLKFNGNIWLQGNGRIVPALNAGLWPRYTIISGGHIVRSLRSIAAQIIESTTSARMAMIAPIVAASKIRFRQIPLVTEFLFSDSLPGVDLGPIFHFYEFGLIDNDPLLRLSWHRRNYQHEIRYGHYE